MPKLEKIVLRPTKTYPKTYSCRCQYCQEYKGVLIRPNGTKYNRNERREYYYFQHGKGGSGHVNPTPLHIARWAIQRFTKVGDWVVDPFTGTGTTLVEAINHNRFALGTELDTADLAQRNIRMNSTDANSGVTAHLFQDDARNIGKYLSCFPSPKLAILHPPYSGDEQQGAKYNRDFHENLAFMKESKAYWKTINTIYTTLADSLVIGGYMVQGVKEMMRNKEWWDLHIRLNVVLSNISTLEYRGMVLLPHYPRTLHLNTYFKRYGVHPSYYQTITIFKKVRS